jgi:hypothetical protein
VAKQGQDELVGDCFSLKNNDASLITKKDRKKSLFTREGRQETHIKGQGWTLARLDKMNWLIRLVVEDQREDDECVGSLEV